MSRLFKLIVFGVVLVVFSSFLYASIFKPTNLDSQIETVSLEQNSVYLFLRGSETKMGGYARQYNKFGGLASHVSLGVFTDSLVLYHINTGNSNPFIIEDLKSFAHSPEESYNYFSIWKLKGMTPSKLDSIQAKIEYYKNANVKFDYRFNLEDQQALYCTEFVYQVVSPAIPELFDQMLHEKVVPKTHRFFLKTDTLTYIPADFFIHKTDQVEQVFEWVKPE